MPATVVITLGLWLVGSLYSLLSSPSPGTVRIVRSWWLSLVRRLRNGVSAHPPTWLIGFPIIQRGRYSVEFYKVVQCTERVASRWYCLLGKIKTGHPGQQDVRSCGSQCPVTVTGKSIELVPGVGRNEKTLSEYFQIKDLTSSGSVESLTLLATPAPVGSYSTAVSSGT